MPRKRRSRTLTGGVLAGTILALAASIFAGSNLPNPPNSNDATGTLSTYITEGGVDISNPFFQSLVTNAARAEPATSQTTLGPSVHPIFKRVSIPPRGLIPCSARLTARTAQPMTSPRLQRVSQLIVCCSTRALYASLWRHPVPLNSRSPAFRILILPASHLDPAGLLSTSVAATKLDSLSAVMWDGREMVKEPTTGYINLTQSLTNQAADATLGHAQATNPPTWQQLAQIVSFEAALYTAQSQHENAGNLTAAFGASGGPVNLSAQPFHIGINDLLGGDPTGAAFNCLSRISVAIWRS